MEQHRQPQANTRRNCDYCVEKKVRCSGRIEGAACAYCARKKHVCVFSVKQKPGPKCLRHHCEEGSSAEGSPAVFPAVAAISSAAAALTLDPSGANGSSAAAAAAAAAATRPPALKSGGGRSGGGDGGGGGRAFSSSSPKRKILGAAPAAGGGRLEEQARAGGGKPATFLNFGPDGGASLPGLPRTASGGGPSMMSGCYPAAGAGAGAGANGGLMDRIGGNKPLSVGTLGAGNGGSFVSGLSSFANGGAAGEMEEEEEEDHRAVFAKIFAELGCDALEDEQQDQNQDQDQDQQNQPPANKKAKTDPLRGLQDSLHQQLQDLQQRRPRGCRPSGGDGGRDGGGGGSATRPPRHDALKPSTTTAQRIATHAAAAAAAVTAEMAKAGETAPPLQHDQHQHQHQQHRLLSRMDSTGSWRRLLSNRNSFLVDGDGTYSGGANSNNNNNNNNNNNHSSSVGGGLTSESSWAAGRAAAAHTASAAAAAAANAADHTANPFLGGFRGRIGPVAEPLDPLMHARSHSYGLGDWLPPADITRDRDLDAFAGALPGVAASVDDGAGAAMPLTGGIVAGRDHQF